MYDLARGCGVVNCNNQNNYCPTKCITLRITPFVLIQKNPCKEGGFTKFMAEGEGFEPPERANAQRFSRPPLSTTQPPLL